MPELPEVETVRRSLEPQISGQTILEAAVYYGGIIKAPDPHTFCDRIKGRRIKSVLRRGKYLIFTLDLSTMLVIHLRMTGQLLVCGREVPLKKHTHLVFRLLGGQELRFIDIRKFGLVYLVENDDMSAVKGLHTLGPEPLGEEFIWGRLAEKLKKRRGTLKAFLLDQSQIAGIGNIYADEILFQAGLHPERKPQDLKPQEVKNLYAAIRFKLQEGIDFRGTSIRDYIDAKGEKGSFQNRLQVYDRAGRPCMRCGQILKKKVIAGRGSVYCPNCQT